MATSNRSANLSVPLKSSLIGSWKFILYLELLDSTGCKKGGTIGHRPRCAEETSEIHRFTWDCARNPTNISIYTLQDALCAKWRILCACDVWGYLDLCEMEQME